MSATFRFTFRFLDQLQEVLFANGVAVLPIECQAHWAKRKLLLPSSSVCPWPCRLQQGIVYLLQSITENLLEETTSN